MYEHGRRSMGHGPWMAYIFPTELSFVTHDTNILTVRTREGLGEASIGSLRVTNVTNFQVARMIRMIPISPGNYQ